MKRPDCPRTGLPPRKARYVPRTGIAGLGSPVKRLSPAAAPLPLPPLGFRRDGRRKSETKESYLVPELAKYASTPIERLPVSPLKARATDSLSANGIEQLAYPPFREMNDRCVGAIRNAAGSFSRPCRFLGHDLSIRARHSVLPDIIYSAVPYERGGRSLSRV